MKKLILLLFAVWLFSCHKDPIITPQGRWVYKDSLMPPIHVDSVWVVNAQGH